MAFIILITPLLFYAYLIVPPVESYETSLGILNSYHYNDLQVLAWVVFTKVALILLLFLWFFTCKHWWYHVIIVPIVVVSYEIFAALNDDFEFIDHDGIYFLIPFVAAMAAFSYGIRIRLFDRIYGVDIDEDLKRVRWNGKIVKVPANSPLDLEEVDEHEVDDEDDEIDDDKEPMWMA